MNTASLFAEVEVCQQRKRGEAVCGDAFFLQKIPGEDRILGVVSDGLGSGIKASLLANMTGTMALRLLAGDLPVGRSADIIMDTLPICQTRKISYATFTMVDTVLHGRTRVVEMGNPPMLLVREGRALEPDRQDIVSEKWPDRVMRLTEMENAAEDRLIVFSDGITQAGLGGDTWKLGWRFQGCRDFVERRVGEEPTVSARRLAQDIVQEALTKSDRREAVDDMTCAVFYFRQPRKLLVLSGPPYDPTRDDEIARNIDGFAGRRAICGGTTANIVARQLRREVRTNLRKQGGDLPPTSSIQGIDLVTEGILTLTRTARYLEAPAHESIPLDGAGQLAELLRESDNIHFMIGTRINDAHQDPTLPVDLEIRRNIIKRIKTALEERYLKKVSVEYI